MNPQPTLTLPANEFWRRRGYALVMLYGSPEERFDARCRAEELQQINRQTEKWMAEQRRLAA